MEKLPTLDLGSKKKKKKKVTSADSAPAGEKARAGRPAASDAAAAPEPVAASLPASFGELNLGEKKKKKKRSKPVSEKGEEDGRVGATAAPEEEGDVSTVSSTSSRPEKKKSTASAPAPEAEDDQYDPNELMQGLYSYQELLGRVYQVMKDRNLDQNVQKRTLKQPHVVKDGAKKTAFTNLIDICKSMNRDPDHCKEFLLSELGTTGNMDGQGSLIIRGKFQTKSVTSILRRYINAYVVCEMCRSLDTTLSRDSATRLHRLYCENCGASRSVAAINKMFTAVIRRPRK